ncbi:MAG TPA: hypothetical protein VFB82_04490 [Blastocatellia bacterium]|nr:hypothetical protein [Blastocatellia bacterium]
MFDETLPATFCLFKAPLRELPRFHVLLVSLLRFGVLSLDSLTRAPKQRAKDTQTLGTWPDRRQGLEPEYFIAWLHNWVWSVEMNLAEGSNLLVNLVAFLINQLSDRATLLSFDNVNQPVR